MRLDEDATNLEDHPSDGRPAVQSLVGALLCWSLALAGPILGSLWQIAGLVMVWLILLRRFRPTWSETRSHLSTKVSLVDAILLAGAFALFLTLPWAGRAIEARLPDASIGAWALLWLVGVVYGIVGFVAARRRWKHASGRDYRSDPSVGSQ